MKNTVKMPWEKNLAGLARGVSNYGSPKNEEPHECVGPDCDTTGPRELMHEKDDKLYCQACADKMGLRENAKPGDKKFYRFKAGDEDTGMRASRVGDDIADHEGSWLVKAVRQDGLELEFLNS